MGLATAGTGLAQKIIADPLLAARRAPLQYPPIPEWIVLS
jgi:hypothetical protein